MDCGIICTLEFTKGVADSQQITNPSGTAPFKFYVISGAIPTGLLLSTSGVLAGTPTAAGAYQFGVRVTDADGDVCCEKVVVNVLEPVLTCEDCEIGPWSGPEVPYIVDYDPADWHSDLVCGYGGTYPEWDGYWLHEFTTCHWGMRTGIPNIQFQSTMNGRRVYVEISFNTGVSPHQVEILIRCDNDPGFRLFYGIKQETGGSLELCGTYVNLDPDHLMPLWGGPPSIEIGMASPPP